MARAIADGILVPYEFTFSPPRATEVPQELRVVFYRKIYQPRPSARIGKCLCIAVSWK